MERATGVEPATSSLGSWHSTTELRPPVPKSRTATRQSQIGVRWPVLPMPDRTPILNLHASVVAVAVPMTLAVTTDIALPMAVGVLLPRPVVIARLLADVVVVPVAVVLVMPVCVAFPMMVLVVIVKPV